MVFLFLRLSVFACVPVFLSLMPGFGPSCKLGQREPQPLDQSVFICAPVFLSLMPGFGPSFTLGQKEPQPPLDQWLWLSLAKFT